MFGAKLHGRGWGRKVPAMLRKIEQELGAEVSIPELLVFLVTLMVVLRYVA